MYKNYNMTQLTLPMETSVLIPTNDIFTTCKMILLKQFLTMNSTNSDITVVQLRTILKMMLKVILYAYTQSVFSGRKIEKCLMIASE